MTEKPSPKVAVVMIILIIAALVFVVLCFNSFSRQQPNFDPQVQPDGLEASNSADFNQQERLEATGASLATPSPLPVTE